MSVLIQTITVKRTPLARDAVGEFLLFLESRAGKEHEHEHEHEHTHEHETTMISFAHLFCSLTNLNLLDVYTMVACSLVRSR
jgi:hypothetical protein